MSFIVIYRDIKKERILTSCSRLHTFFWHNFISDRNKVLYVLLMSYNHSYLLDDIRGLGSLRFLEDRAWRFLGHCWIWGFPFNDKPIYDWEDFLRVLGLLWKFCRGVPLGIETETTKQLRWYEKKKKPTTTTTCTLYQFDGTFRIEFLLKTVLLKS